MMDRRKMVEVISEMADCAASGKVDAGVMSGWVGRIIEASGIKEQDPGIGDLEKAMLMNELLEIVLAGEYGRGELEAASRYIDARHLDTDGTAFVTVIKDVCDVLQGQPLTFEACGMTCHVTRNPLGIPLGYVEVPEGHPARSMGEAELEEACMAHGGITWRGEATRFPGSPWCVGFDMGHASDFAYLPDGRGGVTPVVVSDMTECIEETISLAANLDAMCGE